MFSPHLWCVRAVVRALREPSYARALVLLRAMRVQLAVRSEAFSSPRVDELSHVDRLPSMPHVRGKLETDAVDEQVAVLGARDAPRAACTERLAPCGEASAMDRYVSVLILKLEAPAPPLRRAQTQARAKLLDAVSGRAKLSSER